MADTACIYGDSVAKGVILDNIKNKYTLLKDSFVNRLQSGFEIAVTNYSKFGCTVSKGLELLKKHLSSVSKYDYIVLEFGGNDCDFDWVEVAKDPGAPHRCKTPLDEFERSYTEMIRTIRTNGGHPVILSLPPIDAQRYFNWISQGLDSGQILQFLGDKEHIYRWHEMYNMAVCRIAQTEIVPLIDITTRFLEMVNYQSCICDDGIHPNEKGHAIIAKAIEDFIAEQEENNVVHMHASSKTLACG